MFKVINNTAALFTPYHSYNLCSKSKFVVPSVCTFHNDQNSIQYYGSLIWNMIAGYVKDSETVDILRDKILKWKALLPLQKNIPNLGFIIQIWFSIFAYNPVAYKLNVKGCFTLLADATKMYSVLVDPALHCGVQVLFFELCNIYILL